MSAPTSSSDAGVLPGSAKPTQDAVQAALSTVLDPEIGKPITELDMVEAIQVRGDGSVDVVVLLTVSGCPMRDEITNRVDRAVRGVAGVTDVRVVLSVMSDEQRSGLHEKLRGGAPVRVIPFAQPGSLTRVYGVASGKGGVGKSSVTVNVAVAMAQSGLKVGVLDADIYGHSVPRMFGIDRGPTQVDKMIMPPQAHGVKVISTGMFTRGNAPVTWRGPMLHRALEQFLSDVFWGDLDVLLLDLPPGTGDIAISLAQLVPSSELLIVTTPQVAATEVAERAGTIAAQTRQNVVGVLENMAYLPCPHCDERIDLFGAGGGAAVAERLTTVLGHEVPLLAQIPLDVRLREGGDAGVPLVVSDPDCEASKQLRTVADRLGHRSRGLAGRSLNLSPSRGLAATPPHAH
ncbi:Mrp/NBP35 family ATP-binding protein [Frankia sp. AgB1.9]|uniref:Mrp/NBP35 family ATP-binding protein n=1 Tax=unclassified Frankia TaxID=2632575 RepID=UPI00193245D6|nr:MULTISPECIES: Mrp/NBP35 family ATP-binding protein [unclassified Frankia]MBL7492701.1 Mrp/NBP35 family ATP-binding protein [Frankia sp. AgW1.1]MBL7549683.1 Mrp/NBP35 family ATP-binding protein [Frankia sp. AgB1.9]MBL7623140.1 Mrp/NBP35 family ATP-binding protein [Frankia sp. AgB1.8]